MRRGFTLIELLIVIVILGILAGVVVIVINPTRQQNRAKDAIIKSTLIKISMVLASDFAASNRDPTWAQFRDDVANLIPCSDASVNGTGLGNSFIMNGIEANWKSVNYCTDGGFYLCMWAGQPICVGTYGFMGDWYAVNREGKVKIANATTNPGQSMYHMCQDLASFIDAD